MTERIAAIIPTLKAELIDRFLVANADVISADESVCYIIVCTADFAVELSMRVSETRNIRVLPFDPSLGFAITVNHGLRFALSQTKAEWIGTVNDDVTLSEGWAQALIEEAIDSNSDRVGGVNPVILTPSCEVESAGIEILPKGKAVPLIDLPDAVTQTQALNAACVLYHRKALEQCGLYDERFGSYLEDIELSLRLGKVGWSQLVVPTVTITHLKGQTSSTIQPWQLAWWNLRNWWLILFKHWTRQQWTEHWFTILTERGRNLSGLVKSLVTSNR